jgi:hypothetical protein
MINQGWRLEDYDRRVFFFVSRVSSSFSDGARRDEDNSRAFGVASCAPGPREQHADASSCGLSRLVRQGLNPVTLDELMCRHPTPHIRRQSAVMAYLRWPWGSRENKLCSASLVSRLMDDEQCWIAHVFGTFVPVKASTRTLILDDGDGRPVKCLTRMGNWLHYLPCRTV